MPTVERDQLVTLLTFATAWEAQLARARLEAEGIEAMVVDEHVARLYGGIGHVVGGIKLRVWEGDASRAAAVLEARRPLPEIYLVTDEDAGRPRCPGCRSDNVSFERWSRLGFVSSLLLLGVPLPVPRGRWTCRHCGADWREDQLTGRPQLEPEPELAAVDPDEVVTVARFHTPWEAHLARTRLEAEGIEACVLEERLPVVNLLSGEMPALNRLAVGAGDARRALEILGGLVDSADLLAADGES
jgi:hypothetical protein